MIFGRQAGNENCLHLSVYTKDIEPKNLCPVMVWIHGGAFVLGNNAKEMYNPELLMQKDIVLIAINYRLGALGKFNLYFNFKSTKCSATGCAVFYQLIQR